VSELDDLERRLIARVRAPDATLRGRVLDAPERERRAQGRAWFAAAAAAWLVAGAGWWGAREPAHGATERRSISAELALGPNLAHVPRLARPIGPNGWVSP
jgi:hypothetical protein